MKQHVGQQGTSSHQEAIKRIISERINPEKIIDEMIGAAQNTSIDSSANIEGFVGQQGPRMKGYTGIAYELFSIQKKLLRCGAKKLCAKPLPRSIIAS